MRKTFFVLFGVVLLLFQGCGRKTEEGTVSPLTDEEIRQASDFGAENAELSLTEFTYDWTVDLGYGQGKGNATIITPFLRVALLSRQAALTGKKPDEYLIKAAMKEDAGSMNFEVLLFGGSPKFGRTVQFLLKYNDVELKPSYFFMPPYSEIARDYTQTAKGRVKFKKEGIPADAEVVLAASFKTEEEIDEVSLCEFRFDLKKYR